MKKKTNVNEMREKITRLFKAEMINELQHLYISNDDDGIKAFGKYRIRNHKNRGLFVVAESNWNKAHEFITARNAMAYCVFQHNHQSENASKVYKLDGQLGSINFDIGIHTRGYKTKTNDVDHRLIQLTKLQHDLSRKKQIVQTLEGLINTSKQQQRRIFEEHKKNRYKRSRNSAEQDKYIISTTDY
jgi:hypothetical protein